jgi:hypothetical protein
MADNTRLNPGSSGDVIRDLARQGGATKTQVVALDLGGPAANPEYLIAAGQAPMAQSIPVTGAPDQPSDPALIKIAELLSQLLPADRGLLSPFEQLTASIRSILQEMSPWQIQVPSATIPMAATPICGYGNGAAAAISTTLFPGAPYRTVYLTQVRVTGAGATAASNVNLQIAGVSSSVIYGGSLFYNISIPAGVTTQVDFRESFSPPIQASPGAQITASVSSFGAGNTTAFVTAVGFII